MGTLHVSKDFTLLNEYNTENKVSHRVEYLNPNLTQPNKPHSTQPENYPMKFCS